MNQTVYKIQSSLVSLIISFWISCSSCFALIGLDIAEFHFPSKGQKGIRVAQFDTEKQKFLKIDYFISVTTKSRSFPHLLSVPNIPYLSISILGEVTVESSFDLSQFMIRAKQKITLKDPLNKALLWEDANRYNVLQQDSQPLTGPEAVKKLEAYIKQKKLQADFEVSFYTGSYQKDSKEETNQATFQAISSHANENNQERGELGEIATTLTMISFGYVPLSSKYENNHGNDGIFKSRDNTFLFITESKCRAEAKSADHYLKADLDEREIQRKLEKMHQKGGDIKKIADELESFILERPENVTRFAHRVKSDGTCQCAIKEFLLEHYMFAKKSNSKEGIADPRVNILDPIDDVQLMQKTCTQINAPPKKLLEIFMKANNLEYKDILKMLNLEFNAIHQ